MPQAASCSKTISLLARLKLESIIRARSSGKLRFGLEDLDLLLDSFLEELERFAW